MDVKRGSKLLTTIPNPHFKGDSHIEGKREFGSHHIGMWSAMALVKEHAGNYRRARRLILHDPKPQVDYRWSNPQKDEGPVVKSVCKLHGGCPPCTTSSGATNIWQSVNDGAKWSYDCVYGATPSGAHELWQWNSTWITVDWTNMLRGKWMAAALFIQRRVEFWNKPG